MPSCIAMSRIYAILTRRKELTEITITALIIWVLVTFALLMHFGILATVLGLVWSVVWHFNRSVYKKVRMINNGTIYAYILTLSAFGSLLLGFMNIFHVDSYN
jgi:hypothetical protein|mmetsp:Transcript_8449/g.1157  ORF Transcript_8449/g.1157 Transcript_8449/m.1157 type:complete len:103 (+) Transcript_8449:269-577(+)